MPPERTDEVVDGEEDEHGEGDHHHEEDADAPGVSPTIRLGPEDAIKSIVVKSIIDLRFNPNRDVE